MQNKPSTFPPATHTHAQGDVTGLAAALDGLETRIDGIAPATDPDWTDVQNKPSTFTPSAHSHTQADVTGLTTALAGKAATAHTHAQADVTGLVTALAGKASTTDMDNTFVVATDAQTDANAALAGLETKVNASAVAGLNTVGWGRVIYIANAAPDPTGLPDYTEVIRLPA